MEPVCRSCSDVASGELTVEIYLCRLRLMPRALSSATALVLDALDRGVTHGFDLLDATGLPSGTVYPILRRLEHEGFATSKWEAARLAQQEQRPPRRYYELTREGRG